MRQAVLVLVVFTSVVTAYYGNQDWLGKKRDVRINYQGLQDDVVVPKMKSVNSVAYLPPRNRYLWAPENSKVGAAYIPSSSMSDFRMNNQRRQTFSWQSRRGADIDGAM